MSSDDPTTPRRPRRPASSRLPGAVPALASAPWASMDGIASVRGPGGLIFLALPSEAAADLRDAVEAIVNDPTADERYGERATSHLTGLAEALSDALATTLARHSVREIHPET